MPPQNNDQYQWVTYPYFGGGINNAQPATEIEDDECAEIVNFEFDLSDDLKARNGFIRYNDSPDFTSRITSIFNFITAAGVSNIIVTSGSEIYKDTAGVFSSIKGAVALPSNTYWQWAAFTNLAIGVNQQVGGAEKGIVKWTGAGNIAALTLTGIDGTPDGAHSITVFNSRLWVVFSNKPNRLYYSSLGNAEDWSTSGGFIDIDFDDGDKIIGIKENRGRLFIFKRRKTYALVTGIGGVVNTTISGWSVELFSNNVGCVSRYTIQTVLDDLLFLTDEGIASLKAVTEFGDFKTEILSRKIVQLSHLNLNIDTFSSAVDASRSLYILSAPKLSTGTINNRLYVLDYKKIRASTPATFGTVLGNVRWSFFESSVINPSVIAIVLKEGKKTLFLGGDTPLFYIMYWDHEKVYSDDGQAVLRTFRSKAFPFNNGMERIEVNKIAVKLGFSQADLSATLEIRFNENDSLRDSFPVSLLNMVEESLWDVAIWDVDSFSTSLVNTQIIERKLEVFRRGISAQIKFSNQQAEQDLIIKDLAFNVGKLTSENA